MDIIAKQFTSIGGLQDTLLPGLRSDSQYRGFKYGGGGRVAQVHHCQNEHHWIFTCEVPAGGAGSSQGEVAVFDSLAGSEAFLSSAIKRNLFDIAYPKGSKADTLLINRRRAQAQRGGTQCGDFCIAYMVAFAHGDSFAQMEQQTFDQKAMRAHLADCLQKKTFTRFPTARGPVRSTPSQTYKIHRI